MKDSASKNMSYLCLWIFMVFLEVIEPVIEIVFLNMYDEDKPISTGMIFFMRSYKSKNFVKNLKKIFVKS